jgi:hypothetical protein
MNAYSKIEVEAAHTQEAVESCQCVVAETADTIAEAKRRAKYVLTDDFRRSAELSSPLGYSRIMADGECVYDYFRK